MARTKKETAENNNVEKKTETIKVKFRRSYCGKYGNFIAGEIAFLPSDYLKIFADDVEEIQ